MQYVMPFSKMLRGQEIGAKAKAVRGKLIKKVGFLVVVMVISALFCVWSRVQIVEMGYDVTNLQREAEEQSKTINHLRLEVERLKSPGYLQNMAVRVLNMHAPKGEEIIFVKK